MNRFQEFVIGFIVILILVLLIQNAIRIVQSECKKCNPISFDDVDEYNGPIEDDENSESDID